MTEPSAPPGAASSGPPWVSVDPPPRPLSSRLSWDRILPARILQPLRRLAGARGGPLLLALAFAIVSLPAVVLGVPGYDMSVQRASWTYDSVALPALHPAVVAASMGAVLASVLVAAPIGTLIVRRNILTGALVTIGLAWIAGIVALPVAPSLLGYSYGAVNFCLDSCSPQIVGLTGGLSAFIVDGKPNLFVPLVSPFYGFAPLVALLLGVSLWAPLVGRRP